MRRKSWKKSLRKGLKIGATALVLMVLLPLASAYNYNGARWSYSQADWRFSTDFPSSYQTAVRNAANTWTNAPSVFSFDYDWWELVNKVDWEDLGESTTLAVTITGWSGTLNTTCRGGAALISAVTNFNSRISWTTNPGSSYPPYDMETVALHEFGHWLSLGHSSSGTVMYYRYQGTRRNLAQDDTNGIICIYG